MKRIVIVYAVGVGIGLLLGLYVPADGGDAAALLARAAEFVIRLGRLALFPLFFFSALLAVDELRDVGRFLRHAGRTVAWTAIVPLVAAVTGAGAVSLLRPQRIPPLVQDGPVPELPTVLGELIEAVPANFFALFVAGPNALAPILTAAVLLGLVVHYDRETSSPVVLVCDAANRVFYRLNTVLTTLAGLLVAVPVASLVVVLRGTADARLYGQLLLVVGFAAAFIGLVVFPFILGLLDRSPVRATQWLRSIIAPTLAAVATGDLYFAIASLVHTRHESMEVPRRVGGVVVPFVAVVGRAGTALVGVAAFLVVIRSYTALEIGFGEAVVLTLTGYGISFLLGRYPGSGVVVALAYLAARYERGMEESYLILLPVAVVLQRIAAALDALTVAFVTEVVARAESFAGREGRRGRGVTGRSST